MCSEPRELCIVCDWKINRKNNSTGINTRRGPKAITCSPKCSKIYSKVSNYTRGCYINKISALIRKLEKYEIVSGVKQDEI